MEHYKVILLTVFLKFYVRNMLKPSSYFLSDWSKAMILL